MVQLHQDEAREANAAPSDSTRYALLNDLLQRRRLRLRFPDEMETEFRSQHALASARNFRSSVFYVLLLYLVLGLGIMAILPPESLGMWPQAYSLILLLIVVAVICSRRRSLDAWHQHYVTALAFPGMAALVILPEFTRSTLMEQASYMGIIHATIVTGTLLGLRALPAVIATWGGGYTGVVLLLMAGGMPEWLLLHQTLTAGCGVTTVVAWILEKRSRQVFLQQSLLSLEKSRSDAMAERMKEMSRHDALTGLANRRHFDEVLQQEFQRCLRDGASLSLVFLDVDFFKPYNDLYGHQAGDECLKRVGEIIAGYARRPGDLAARYGGEEFVVLYPQTGPHSLHQLAETLRAEVAEAKIPHERSTIAEHVTVSIGTASVVPEATLTPERLVAAADHAVYEAKRLGRNRVINEPVHPAKPDQDPGTASVLPWQG